MEMEAPAEMEAALLRTCFSAWADILVCGVELEIAMELEEQERQEMWLLDEEDAEMQELAHWYQELPLIPMSPVCVPSHSASGKMRFLILCFICRWDVYNYNNNSYPEHWWGGPGDSP